MSKLLTADTFAEKIFDYQNNQEWSYKGDIPCVIDFYADWCGPCKMISPIIDQLSEEYAGKVNFYKVDTEQEQELAMLFGIRSIPALLFIPLQGEPKMATGAAPKEAIQSLIEQELFS